MKLIEHRKIRKANVHAGDTILTEFEGSLKNLAAVMRSQKVGLRTVSWLKRMFINENEGVENAVSFIVRHIILQQDGDSFEGRIKGFEAWRGELTGFLEGNTHVKNKNVKIQKCERFKHEAKSWKNSLEGAVQCLERIKARVNTAKQSFKAVYGNDSGIDSPAVSSAMRSLVSALDNIISKINGFDYIDELKDDGYFMLALDKMIERLTANEPGSPEEDEDEEDDPGEEDGETLEDGDSDPSDSEDEDDDEDDEEENDDTHEEPPSEEESDSSYEELEQVMEKIMAIIDPVCEKLQNGIIKAFTEFTERLIKLYNTDKTGFQIDFDSKPIATEIFLASTDGRDGFTQYNNNIIEKIKSYIKNEFENDIIEDDLKNQKTYLDHIYKNILNEYIDLNQMIADYFDIRNKKELVKVSTLKDNIKRYFDHYVQEIQTNEELQELIKKFNNPE